MLLYLLALALALMGVAVSIWEPKKPRQKRRWFVMFVLVGAAATVVQFREDTLRERALRSFLVGDQSNPPFVTLIPGTSTLRVLVSNDSDYPIQIMQVRLWNPDDFVAVPNLTLDDLMRRSLVFRQPGFLAPRSAQVVGSTPLPAQTSAKYAATIMSTLGEWRQQFRLETVSGKWTIATRLTNGYSDDWVEKKVDSFFPRNAKGKIDW